LLENAGDQWALQGGVVGVQLDQAVGALFDGRALTAGELGRVAGVGASTASENLAALTSGGLVTAASQGRHRYFAHTCFDHLAGRLGVAVLAALVDRRWLAVHAGGFEVTPEGADGFAALGVDTDVARNRRRRFAYPCLDWTDRRPHLAGALAAAITTALLGAGWVQRTRGQRAITVTPAGRAGLQAMLGIECEGHIDKRSAASG
jgi:DNA-binding transcriptional ArsR family regulator